MIIYSTLTLFAVFPLACFEWRLCVFCINNVRVYVVCHSESEFVREVQVQDTVCGQKVMIVARQIVFCCCSIHRQ